MSKFKMSLVVALLLAIPVSLYELTAETVKPDKEEGLYIEILHTTPLQGEIPNVKDFSFRMRLITVEPGGHTSFHVHKNRPGIAYIISGSVINHMEGKPPEIISAGEIFYETQGCTHYIENKGTISATLVAADIVTNETE